MASSSGGTIRQRSNGRWEGRVFTDGRQQSVYAKTKKECQSKMRKVLTDADNGIRTAPGSVTVATWLDEWMETVVQPRLRPTTVASYEHHVDRYLKPAIGRIALVKLEPRDVSRMLARMPEHLSPTTKRYTHNVLRAALNRAVKRQLVVRNVALLVDLPAKSDWTMEPLDETQVRTLQRAIVGDRHEALYTLALATGARQGELLALRWSDIDLGTGIISIRHTLNQGTTTLGEPKTEAGKRDLRVGPTVLAILRRHRTTQNELRLKAGRKWQDMGFIFTTSTGRPLDARNVTRWFQATLERAALPRQRFHDLRHAYATIALSRGVDLALVSKSLGHAQVSTTADIYLHWVPAMQDEIAETMETVLAG
jgi:integrase